MFIDLQILLVLATVQPVLESNQTSKFFATVVLSGLCPGPIVSVILRPLDHLRQFMRAVEESCKHCGVFKVDTARFIEFLGNLGHNVFYRDLLSFQ